MLPTEPMLTTDTELRVGITATADSGHRIADHARTRGLCPVLLPCIEVEPIAAHQLDSIREAAAKADWIVLTSSRAVTTVWPVGSMPAIRVAAVGQATADAVRRAGGLIELVGDEGANRLFDRLAPRIEGASVVYPHAASTATDLASQMVAAGAVVRHEAVYRIVPISPRLDPVDAVLLGSPSAVRGWCSSRTLDGLLVATTGQTTAEAVRQTGYSKPIVPDRPGFEAALALLANQHADRASPTTRR